MGARKGQHFLANLRVAERIAQEIGEGKVVVEIGGGKGFLTRMIASKNKVYSIEIEEGFKEHLIKAGAEPVIADFLEVEPIDCDVVVGNIPYYISSAVVMKLREWKFEKAIIMLQKEFVDAMMAKPRERKYGRLSVMAQMLYSIRRLLNVGKWSFSPPPKVDSVLVELMKKGEVGKDIEDFVRVLFHRKNKVLRWLEREYGVELKEKWKRRRARELGIEEIKELFSELKPFLKQIHWKTQ
ncbi:MAG: rRNA adenine N-6-methyltransferase family protein [Candidatus Anstonellales archaeon]